jgi:hypothetical protein
MKTKSLPSIVSLLAFLVVFSDFGMAQQAIQASPTKFIAYSLYNFSKFIDWPADVLASTFQIAVVGDKTVFQELQELSKNKKLGACVYQITFYKNTNEITGMNHIIYLSNFYSGKVHELSGKISIKGVLFVTEREGMTSQGSSISFLTNDNGSMGFEIARDNAAKSQLVIHKQLEKLASKVI